MMKALLAASLLTPCLCMAAEKIAPKTLEFLEATTISGYVQASYQHSWPGGGDQNAPGTPQGKDSAGITPGHPFNNSRNSFDLDQAKLTLEKPIGDGDFGAGYRVDLLFGDTARWIHSTHADGSTFNLGNDGDLEQAYVQFRIPVGAGLEVKFGKFVTLLGNEVIDAPGNWNYSRSYIFNYGEPLTHTGALLSYAFSKADEKNPVGVDMQLAVVNGWDNVQDNNSFKSVMGRLGVTLLNGKLVFATMGIVGPEQNSNNENYRWVINEVITYNPTDKLSFALEALYGHENFDKSVFARGDAHWWGGAIYGKYQWAPHFSTAARAEYFSDEGGTRLSSAFGTPGGAGITPVAVVFPNGQTLNVQEYTLSAQFDQIWKNLTPRLEVRYDHINHQVFTTDAIQSAFTASLDFIYAF